jgi:hypothetical protein
VFLYPTAEFPDDTPIDHARFAISENLHRAGLSKMERDEQIAEWIKITEKLSSQVATKGLGHRPEGGVK